MKQMTNESIARTIRDAYIAGWENGKYDAGDHDCRMLEPSARRSWEEDEESKPFRDIVAELRARA